MVEFCWLTLPDRDEEVRAEFVGGTLSLLPGMRESFEEAGTPYHELLAALELLLEHDLALSVDQGAVSSGSKGTDERPTLDAVGIGAGGEVAGPTGGDG